MKNGKLTLLVATISLTIACAGCKDYDDYYKAQVIEQAVIAKATRQIEWFRKPYDCKDMAAHFLEMAKERGIEAERRTSFNPNRCAPHAYVRIAGVGDFLNLSGYKDCEEHKEEMMKWFFTRRPKLCKDAGEEL